MDESSIDGSLNESGVAKDWSSSQEDENFMANLRTSTSKKFDLNSDSGRYIRFISELLSENGYDMSNVSQRMSSFLNSLSELQSAFLNPWSETLHGHLQEIFRRWDRQKEVAQAVHQSAKKGAMNQDAMLAKIEELQDLTHAYEQREKELKMKLRMQEEAKNVNGKDNQKVEIEFKKKIKGLETIIKEHERRYRQKEQEFDKLRKRLLSASEKNANNNSTLQNSILNTSSFSITSPSPSRKPLSNAEKLEQQQQTINALESDRRSLRTQILELELMNKDLLATLNSPNTSATGNLSFETNRTNFGKNRRNFTGNLNEKSEISEENLDENMDENQSKNPGNILQLQQRKIQELTYKLEVAKSLEHEHDLERQEIGSRCRELCEEIDNLRLEISARPSVKQWNSAQREIQEMEMKIHELVLLRGESNEINAWRKHLSTAERIKVDKRNHELGLYLLESLPKQILKESLQHVCRELDLSEVSEIPSALSKLKSVVRAVPRMERFIAKMTNFLLDRNLVLNEKLGLIDASRNNVGMNESVVSFEKAFVILQRWWNLVQKCVDLEHFKENVLFELFRAQELLTNAESYQEFQSKGPRSTEAQNMSLKRLRDFWEDHGRQEYLLRDPSVIISKLRDMADLQVEVLISESSVKQVEGFLRDRPDILVNRVISHLLYLLDVKSIDGLLPKVNSIFVFNEEAKNFLSAVKSTLGKEKQQVSHAVIMDDVLAILAKLKVSAAASVPGAINMLR